METALSLFWIAVVAVLGPLLAGHEIELKELTGRGGRRTLVTWLSCFVLALLLVGLLGLAGIVSAEVAVGIGLISAFGVLLPILRDSGQLSTPFGATILTHGAFGELGPVIAMAVLLGTRGALKSILVLLLFAVIAVGVTYAATRDLAESGLGRLVSAGQETTAQLTVRLVVLLVIALSLLAAAFEFDIVLGALLRVHPASRPAGGACLAGAQARRAGVRTAHPGLLRHVRDGDRSLGRLGPSRRPARLRGRHGRGPGRSRPGGDTLAAAAGRHRATVLAAGPASGSRCTPRPGCRSSSPSPRSPSRTAR
jgi:hypothetical protein